MSKRSTGLMSWLFGKQITAKDLLRKNQRVLNRSIRELDTERSRMEWQEKKIIVDIKKLAKEGHIDTVRILAKDLVRTRAYIQRFMIMKANLQAVLIKIRTVQSQQSISDAMLGVTLALRNMNRQFQLPCLQRILQEFEKQSALMGIKEEIMTEAIDETVCEAEEERESDEVVAQILDELGLELRDQLAELPEAKGVVRNSVGKLPVASKSTNDRSSVDADLEARLNNLRNGDNGSNLGFPSIPPGNPKKRK